MQVLGTEVDDPRLRVIGIIAFIALFMGGFPLVLTQKLVDEARLRAEPSISQLFGRLPPRRVLTDFGRKVQTFAYVSLTIGAALMIYLIAATRK